MDSLTVEDCLQRLDSLTRQLHRLRVGTLDALFLQMARCHGLELHLPNDWRIVEDTDDAEIRSAALQTMLEIGESRDIMRLVHSLAKGEAVRRLENLLLDTVQDHYQVFLDSTPDAWERLPRWAKLDESELELTLDDLREYPLERKCDQKARSADLQRACDQDWGGFLKSGFAGKVLSQETVYQRKEIPSELVRIYERLIEHARGEVVGRLGEHDDGRAGLVDSIRRHLSATQTLTPRVPI